MAIDQCDACACIRGTMSPEEFYQRAIIVLCDILNGASGSETNVNIAQYGGVATSLGQKAMATSIPVVIASDQSAISINPGTAATWGLYAEDTAATTGFVGSAILGVSNEALTAKAAVNDDYTQVSTTSKGVVLVAADINGQIAQATGLLKAEDSAHVTGDAGVLSFAVANRTQAQFSNSDGDYTPVAVGLDGSVYIQINRLNQTDNANSLLKAEDVGHVTGDAGVAVWAVRNDNTTQFTNTNLDYSPIAVSAYGMILPDISYTNQSNTAQGLLKREDVAAGDGDAGVAFLAKRRTTPTDDVSANGDYDHPGTDGLGNLWTHPTVGVTGGATPFKLISAGSTNSTLVKAGATSLYGIQLSNINAAVRYLKLYDKATAPTVGTDTPVKTILIPGSTTGGVRDVNLPIAGIAFTLGLGIGLTTGVADNDTGAVAANEQVVGLDYK